MKNRNDTKSSKKSLTQQQFKKESDINNIVDRYLPKQFPPSVGRPKFGDFTGHDFQTMMNSISSVETQFAFLPASIRRKFQNSPLACVQWVEDPTNKAEATKLGLLPDDGSLSLADSTASPVVLQSDPEANPRKSAPSVT